VIPLFYKVKNVGAIRYASKGLYDLESRVLVASVSWKRRIRWWRPRGSVGMLDTGERDVTDLQVCWKYNRFSFRGSATWPMAVLPNILVVTPART
jgi:hypothetical protein